MLFGFVVGAIIGVVCGVILLWLGRPHTSFFALLMNYLPEIMVGAIPLAFVFGLTTYSFALWLDMTVTLAIIWGVTTFSYVMCGIIAFLWLER